MGTVYLFHFATPYKHARHYLGWTDDPAQRWKAHGTSSGARIMQVVKEAGIEAVLVRTWWGSRSLERKLKNLHDSPMLCPICNPSVVVKPGGQKKWYQTVYPLPRGWGGSLFSSSSPHCSSLVTPVMPELVEVDRDMSPVQVATLEVNTSPWGPLDW